MDYDFKFTPTNLHLPLVKKQKLEDKFFILLYLQSCIKKHSVFQDFYFIRRICCIDTNCKKIEKIVFLNLAFIQFGTQEH